jgi:snurportin-1
LRIDAARNIDLFAGLSLSERGTADGDDSESSDDNTMPASSIGVARFLNQMDPPLSPPASGAPNPNPPSSISKNQAQLKQPKPKVAASKPKGKSKRSKQRKATKWADKCMYAELLEMRDTGDTWASGGDDGLPKDLEREWVALAPVPKGKRCVAVSFAPSTSGPDEGTYSLTS